ATVKTRLLFMFAFMLLVFSSMSLAQGYCQGGSPGSVPAAVCEDSPCIDIPDIAWRGEEAIFLADCETPQQYIYTYYVHAYYNHFAGCTIDTTSWADHVILTRKYKQYYW